MTAAASRAATATALLFAVPFFAAACTRGEISAAPEVPAPLQTPSESIARPLPPLPAPPFPPENSNSTLTNRGCGGSRKLSAHFYDVGQGLAVLVDLPDGRHILVDTGDFPRKPPGCERCSADEPLLPKLAADLKGAPIDLLWITHPHADHIGGAIGVLRTFRVGAYVDNGRDSNKPEVMRARHAALMRGVTVHVVDPNHRIVPLDGAADLRLTAVVPSAWPTSCSHDANECSIGLRVDYRSSSALFVGDEERDEEVLLEPGVVTLLQVGHHGSETSTTPMFLAKTRPHYAVISAGKPGEGLNRDYCHPRAQVVTRLTRFFGERPCQTLTAFDGTRCDRATPDDWIGVPASDHLWATERDGDVVLETPGDGTFVRR